MKTVLVTGSTDGIGLETVKMLVNEGHSVILHGRNKSKLDDIKTELEALHPETSINIVQADLTSFDEVMQLAREVKSITERLDVLVNNAGVFAMENPVTSSGLDARFMVNTIAPYMLTQQLMEIMTAESRVVNVSSAAQAPIDFSAMRGELLLSDSAAYAQSKLAITMWTKYLADKCAETGPKMVSVNPKSFLGSKMVKTAYGIAGGDVKLGAKILMEASLSSRFENVKGDYFDNDNDIFAAPHPYALEDDNMDKLMNEIEQIIRKFT